MIKTKEQSAPRTVLHKRLAIAAGSSVDDDEAMTSEAEMIIALPELRLAEGGASLPRWIDFKNDTITYEFRETEGDVEYDGRLAIYGAMTADAPLNRDRLASTHVLATILPLDTMAALIEEVKPDLIIATELHPTIPTLKVIREGLAWVSVAMRSE